MLRMSAAGTLRPRSSDSWQLAAVSSQPWQRGDTEIILINSKHETNPKSEFSNVQNVNTQKIWPVFRSFGFRKFEFVSDFEPDRIYVIVEID